MPFARYCSQRDQPRLPLVRTTGAAFCLSGAGPTLLCITRNPGLREKLAQKLDKITDHHWDMLPLHIEFQGAHVIDCVE